MLNMVTFEAASDCCGFLRADHRTRQGAQVQRARIGGGGDSKRGGYVCALEGSHASADEDYAGTGYHVHDLRVDLEASTRLSRCCRRWV